MMHSFIQTLRCVSDNSVEYIHILFTRLRRVVTRPMKKLLKRRTRQIKEQQWSNAARIRDSLFCERTLSRYRAHYTSTLSLPALTHKPPHAPITQEDWDALSVTQLRQKREPMVDIIMPISDNYHAVTAALYNLLRQDSTIPFRVVVILATHPDHKLTDKLRRLQELDLFDLLQVQAHESIIELINFAMQRHETRDIVLLSSACEVPEGWLASFHLTLQSCAATTASISPWCSTGGITGYPDPEGSLACYLDNTHELSAMCQEVFAQAPCPVLPYPALECCYLTRESIHVSGLLPEESPHLPHALSSWAAKAMDKGFEHIWHPRVFMGTTLDTSPRSISANRQSFLRFDRENAVTESLDTFLMEYRELLDRNRLLSCIQTRTLLITGIPALLPQGVSHLTLSPDTEMHGHIRLGAPDPRAFSHLSFAMDETTEYLYAIIAALNITHIELHHLAGFPSRMLDYILRISAELAIPYHLYISDDYLICPGLIGVNKQCEAGDLESSYQSFIATQPLDSDGMPLWLWRERAKRLVHSAAHITYSQESIATLYARYYPHAS